MYWREGGRRGEGNGVEGGSRKGGWRIGGGKGGENGGREGMEDDENVFQQFRYHGKTSCLLPYFVFHR